jgi:mannose-1-phosphate guanylyltransferase
MRDSRRDLWAVVLAGGAGDPPAPLRHTLERVARLIPPSQTVVVTHADDGAAEVAGYPAVTVLAQPCDRGTAAGVLLAAHWIRARVPGAVAAVVPTNHLIVEESVPMSHVVAAGEYVRDHPEWLLLLGVHPAKRGSDRAWIEPGEPVGWTGRGAVHRIRALHEKPPADLAHRLHGRVLCNTFVFTASVTALVQAGLACLPLLHDRLTRFDLFTGTRYETMALQQAYLFAPTADFSRAILASATIPLAVVEVPALTWSDLGTPERVAGSVAVEDRRE